MDEINVIVSKPKRILGMTVAQLVILACLAFTALGTVCGGLIFISGSTGAGLSIFPTPVPTLTLQPTFTPFLTATPTLTPTPTLVPYDELIPSGWKQFTTNNIELWVPPQFNPVDINKERQARVKLYRDLGYDDVAEELENSPPAYVFWFKDSNPGNTMFIPNITVETILMTSENLDTFLEQEYTSGLQEFVIVNRKDFQIGSYEARRLLLEANLSNIYVGVAQYAIYDGTNVWLISSGSHFNQFYTLLPEFDQIARTFRLIGQ